MGFHGRDHADESLKAGVALSQDDGRTWADRVIIAAQQGVDFREPDTLSLADGGLLAVMRTDTEPFASYQSVSSDGASPGRRRQQRGSAVTARGCSRSEAGSPASTETWIRTVQGSVSILRPTVPTGPLVVASTIPPVPMRDG